MNWIYGWNFQNYENFDLYIVSLYWTTTTIATVGYGDIVPINVNEKAYALVIMTIGIIFYSYSVSSLTTILSTFEFRNSRLSQKIYAFDAIAREYNLNSHFYLQVAQALEFAHNSSKFQAEEVINDLPASLANQILVIVYEKDIINNIFFEKKSMEFVA